MSFFPTLPSWFGFKQWEYCFDTFENRFISLKRQSKKKGHQLNPKSPIYAKKLDETSKKIKVSFDNLGIQFTAISKNSTNVLAKSTDKTDRSPQTSSNDITEQSSSARTDMTIYKADEIKKKDKKKDKPNLRKRTIIGSDEEKEEE